MLNKQFEEPSETDWSVFILKANLENTYWNYIGVVTIQLNFELCFAFRNACENVSTHNAQHVLCLPYVYIYVAQITVHGKFMFISPQAISLMINLFARNRILYAYTRIRPNSDFSHQTFATVLYCGLAHNISTEFFIFFFLHFSSPPFLSSRLLFVSLILADECVWTSTAIKRLFIFQSVINHIEAISINSEAKRTT